MNRHFVVLPEQDHNFADHYIRELLRKRFSKKEDAEEWAAIQAKGRPNTFVVYEVASAISCAPRALELS